MTNNDQGDPRDEYERGNAAPAGRGNKQEVFGPTDSLNKSALDVGMLRMEMDASMEYALRHRRRMEVVEQQIREMALYNDAAAGRCVYALPRADKAIIGPSIGLATIIATAWGNCIDGGWFIRTDRADKVVICGGAFFDFQTNRRSWATVTRRISGRSGQIYSDDMIAVTIQAATSIAQRNAILKGVPSPIWRPVYEEALIVVRGTEATLPERRSKMIAAFANFGVKAERVLGALGAKTEKDITLDHLVVLRGMYEQLKDEAITAEEMFDPRRMTGKGFDTVDNPLADAEEEGPGPAQAAKPAGNAAGEAAAQTEPEPGPTSQNEPGPAEAKADGKKTEPKRRPAKAAAEPKPAAAATEPAKPAATQQPAKPAEPEAPKDATEYTAYAIAWMSACTNANSSEAEFENRWKSERDMRMKLSVMSDDLETLQTKRAEKRAELKGEA